MEPINCTETSVINNYYSPRNKPDERSLELNLFLISAGKTDIPNGTVGFSQSLEEEEVGMLLQLDHKHFHLYVSNLSFIIQSYILWFEVQKQH
jgi:hypothetical protein